MSVKQQFENLEPIIYSAMYRPDRAFMAELKRLDERLDCQYRIDLERFVMTWSVPIGPPSELFVVKDDFGGFRHPDIRDLHMLCEGDLHRTDMKERLDKTEKYMTDYRIREELSQKDDIRNMTKDGKIQLMNAYRAAYNTGGKPSAFRRVVPKARGRTADELTNAIAR